MEFGRHPERSGESSPMREPSGRSEISAAWIIGGTMVAGAALLALCILTLVLIGTTSDRSAPTGSPQPDRELLQLIFLGPLDEFGRSALATHRLSVCWQEATPELVTLLHQLLTAERAALGIAALATGFDLDAAPAELTNQGNVPPRTSPQKIRVHFGSESTIVSTFDAPPYVRKGILEPGQSTSGLISFVARIEVGVATRLGGGALAYADPQIEVTSR
jgi:hypothetical protein